MTTSRTATGRCCWRSRTAATNDLVGNGLVGPAWPASAGSVAPAVLTTG